MKSLNVLNGVPWPQRPKRTMYAIFRGSDAPVADAYTTRAFGKLKTFKIFDYLSGCSPLQLYIWIVQTDFVVQGRLNQFWSVYSTQLGIDSLPYDIRQKWYIHQIQIHTIAAIALVAICIYCCFRSIHW